MRRSILAPATVATLLAFGTLIAKPASARADVADADRPTLAQQQPPPPGYYPPPPPGYYPPPPQPYYAPPLEQPKFTYHTEERPRWGLVVAGAVLFGSVYVPTAVFGGSYGDYGYIIPIVGPFFELTSSTDPADRAANAFLVLNALAQATGVALFIAGFAAKKKVLVTDQLAIVPAALPGGGGLAAVGVW